MATQEPISSKVFNLNNGLKLPGVGFGTYRIRQGDVLMKCVDVALDAGYRMFDTASVYGNEHHLKNAFKTLLPKYGLEREDIFITTKLSPYDLGGRIETELAYQKSLDNLGLSIVDAFLIHFPGSARIPAHDVRNAELREKTWKTLAELYDDGKVNAIGVSNFTVKHLKELIINNHGIVPVINQVEWHPYYHQEELLQYCRANDIVLQAYCSFGGTSSSKYDLIQDPTVTKLAQKHEVTNAQVLLAWTLQQDIAVIPKSTNPDHIRENINLNFRLSDAEILSLNKLGEKNIKYAWSPSSVY